MQGCELSSASSSPSGSKSGLNVFTRRRVLIALLTVVSTLVVLANGDLLLAAKQDVRFVFKGNAALSPKELQKAAAEELENYRKRGY